MFQWGHYACAHLEVSELELLQIPARYKNLGDFEFLFRPLRLPVT